MKTCKVLKVHDGDTLSVLLDNEKVNIRLWGIDAPEIGQKFGEEAQVFLHNLIYDKEIDVDIVTTDLWNRQVCKIYLDKIFINSNLVEAGLAWWYDSYYPKEQELKSLEESARTKRVGLWSDDNPTSPWRWRKSVKIQQMEAWLNDPKVREVQDKNKERITDIELDVDT